VRKGRTKPECHPNRAHYAKGLCASCYHARAKKKKKHKQPVRVIHTHEVIRQQPERKHTMATAHDEPKAKDSVAGYSGTAHEGKKVERPKDASKEAVVSEAGVTEPTQVFGGDGVTPIAEWEESQKERREKQAEFDEKRRKQAVEDSGVIQTTEKHGVAKGKANG
jgi:hypothetical protein